MSIDNGFIALHRKILQWEWYDDNNVFRVFVHCLLRANHKDNTWRGTTIKRGQFISSRAKISKELKLGEQQVRTALSKLKATGEVTSSGKSQHTVFTVLNYDSYQNTNQLDNQQVTSSLTNKQPASNQRVTTNNNVNNDNKRNNTPPLDYSVWPSKPSEQILKDWIDLRKSKKAKISQTVINRFGKELKLAVEMGYTVDQCFELSVYKGWVGFEAAWMQNSNIVPISAGQAPAKKSSYVPTPMPKASEA